MKSTLLVLTLSLTAVLAHMQLNYPAPFGAANNPHRTDPADPYLQYPFNCCGRKTPFPCGGHLNLLGTPQGAPVASWAAGSTQNFSLTGIGNHWGGSCQVGFSVDTGKTFQVATSYQGNCPHRNGGINADGQTFDFTVPADIPTGDVVFAWTWYNREQEFNMNCAAITITPSTSSRTIDRAPPAKPADPAPAPSSSSYTDPNGCTCTCTATNFKPAPPSARSLSQHKHKRAHAYGGRASVDNDLVPRTDTPTAPKVPYHQRPGFLIADTGNGCETPHTTAEVKFPNPGPDVVEGDGAYPLVLPGPGGICGY